MHLSPIQRRTRRIATVAFALPLALLVSGTPTLVDADTTPQATVITWSMPTLTAATTVATPNLPLLPITCTATIENNGSLLGQSATVNASAACSNVEDTFGYAWEWDDQQTGQILTTGGQTLTNTATVSTSSSTSLGTVGSRRAKVCFTTTKVGFVDGYACAALGNI